MILIHLEFETTEDFEKAKLLLEGEDGYEVGNGGGVPSWHVAEYAVDEIEIQEENLNKDEAETILESMTDILKENGIPYVVSRD